MSLDVFGSAYGRANDHLRALVAIRNGPCLEEVVSILRELNVDTSICESTIDAFATLEKRAFRIVILDAELDDANAALRISESIRRRSSSFTYVALVTDSLSPDARHEAFLKGVDAIFDNPLDRDDFIQRLKTAQRIFEAEHEMGSMAKRLKAANEKMAIASRRFEELFDGLPVACFTVGPDGLIYEWNREAEDAFGAQSAVAFMQPVQTLLGASSRGFWSQDILDEVRSAGEMRKYQWSHISSNGQERAFIAHLYPCVGNDPASSGVICANADITDRVVAHKQIQSQMIQLEQMNRKLEQLATTDGLTGLYNHRFFQDSLARAVADSGAALILLDVDRFKQFNDSFGHQAGDNVLKQVGAVLSGLVSGDQIAARYGGEEFAVIMPGVGESDALAFAEVVRKTIQSQAWVEREVTASIGVSITAPGMTTTKELIRKADESLYASKEAGRNQVTFWSPDLPVKAA